MSAPLTVYVLRYEHRHGDDIDVYATGELADAAVADIARQYWDYAAGTPAGREAGLPESADGLSDAEVTQMYFDVLGDVEWYEIIAAEVKGGST